MPIIHAVFRGFVQTQRNFLAAGIAMGEDMLDLRPDLRFAPVGLHGPGAGFACSSATRIFRI